MRVEPGAGVEGGVNVAARPSGSPETEYVTVPPKPLTAEAEIV